MGSPHKNTSIHTHIIGKVRISSIYRLYEILDYRSWAWETLVWDGDKIIDQLESVDDVAVVIDMHRRYCDDYLSKIEGVE